MLGEGGRERMIVDVAVSQLLIVPTKGRSGFLMMEM